MFRDQWLTGFSRALWISNASDGQQVTFGHACFIMVGFRETASVCGIKSMTCKWVSLWWPCASLIFACIINEKTNVAHVHYITLVI